MMTHANLLMFSAVLALSGACFGCDSGARSTLSGARTGGGAAMQEGTGGAATNPTGSLAQKYADHFPIGVALGSFHLSTMASIVDHDFNHLTCENAMKIQDIHPAEASFAWEEA